jgi:hypothetical protein
MRSGVIYIIPFWKEHHGKNFGVPDVFLGHSPMVHANDQFLLGVESALKSEFDYSTWGSWQKLTTRLKVLEETFVVYRHKKPKDTCTFRLS